MAQSNLDQSSTVGITKNSLVTFESGQRRCGPPVNWADCPPGKGCEIFIAKIPKDCFEKELIPIFSEIGDIYTFRLMMENETNHRGFGFCVYTKHETAKEAVLKLNNYQIKKNWFLGVCFSVDNCRLFVGGIPKLKTKMEIFEEMNAVTEDVVDIIVYPSAADKNKNRGFAFVEYTTHKAAAVARKKMITNGTQLWGIAVAVDWAEPERKVEDEIMQKVKILYVRNLMLTTTEEEIFRIFSKYLKDTDEILKVKKIGDFAFVHFKNRDQAEIVKNMTHGMNLDGSTIEVHFAKPVNKTEQHQKLLKKSSAILNKALPLLLSNDLNRLSIGSNGNKNSCLDNMDKNEQPLSRSFRNAAGRCSMKSKQMMKNMENYEMMTNNYTALLNSICQKQGLGVPFYAIIPMIFPQHHSNIHVFMAQVYIPNIKCNFPSKSPSFTQEEAILSASENALQWLYYNGIQIPMLLSSSEKTEQTPKFEKLFCKPSEDDVFYRVNSNPDTTESTNLLNRMSANKNHSIFYVPQLFQYNTLHFGSNYVPQNSFFNNPDVNDYNLQNSDENRYSV